MAGNSALCLYCAVLFNGLASRQRARGNQQNVCAAAVANIDLSITLDSYNFIYIIIANSRLFSHLFYLFLQ